MPNRPLASCIVAGYFHVLRRLTQIHTAHLRSQRLDSCPVQDCPAAEALHSSAQHTHLVPLLSLPYRMVLRL